MTTILFEKKNTVTSMLRAEKNFSYSSQMSLQKNKVVRKRPPFLEIISKLFFTIILFFSTVVYGQDYDSIDSNRFYYSAFEPSSSISKVFSKLNRIHAYESNNPLNIIHFGDSHIQGDFFSGEIRKILQSEFGGAGQGIIFPYSLCKSYGPKGVKASTKGNWMGLNILKNVEKTNMGIKGYRLSTSTSNAELSIEITDKFVGKTSNRIAIWTSSDSNSFDYKLDESVKLIYEKNDESNLKCRVYESDSNIRSFNLSLIKSQEKKDLFYFHGFEFISNETSGINYHQCGVVGAQFTHLIFNADLLQSQIKQLSPDLIIFSFGTNEAYNQRIDTNYYYQSISDFMQTIRKSLPEVEIIITTAPDTRSQGRVPPNEQKVNRQLIRLARDFDLSLFDLNKAMGGWGSLNYWHQNKLALDDKLHFHSNGYSLQGKIFAHSFLKEYNQGYNKLDFLLKELDHEIQHLMQPIIANKMKITFAEKEKNDSSKNVVQSKLETKKSFYTVKSGDTISTISKRHHLSVNKLLKANNLSEKSIIRPNQQLIIPTD